MLNVNEVVVIDYSKFDGKSVKVLNKNRALVAKSVYENGTKTDKRYYVGEYIIAEGDLAGQEFSVKFDNDYSGINAMTAIEIEFDTKRSRLWSKVVDKYANINLSLWGKSVRIKELPRSGNTGV